VEVDGGRLTGYLGNYDDYLSRQVAPSGAEGPARPVGSQSRERDAVPTAGVDRRRSRRRDLEREIEAIRARLGVVEGQIHELEARLAEIGLTLADPELYRDGERAREAAQARKDTEKRVAWLMREWEELSLRLSAVKEEA